MTDKKLQALLLKRMNELDRWYGQPSLDPEGTADAENDAVYQVAEEMARAGFPRLHKAGLALLTNGKAERAKSYLSHCLKALRRERLARAKAAAADSAAVVQVADAPLTAADVARRLRISNRVAYELLQRGQIPFFRVGRSIRVRPEDLDAYIDSQNGAGRPDPLACHRRSRKPRRP